MKTPTKIEGFPGLESNHVAWYDPGELLTDPNYDPNDQLWLVSFGGSAWPCFYVVPSEKHDPGHNAPIEQAIEALLDTPEAENYVVDEADPDYDGHDLWYHEGWNEATDGHAFDRDSIELVRELTEDETAFMVDWLGNLLRKAYGGNIDPPPAVVFEPDYDGVFEIYLDDKTGPGDDRD